MKNLFLGNGNQLSFFWPRENTEFISRKDINISYIKSKEWKNVYISYSNGQTFLKDWWYFTQFYQDNVAQPLAMIDAIKDNCEKIYLYSTTELWNKYNGPINTNKPFNFDQNLPYVRSKEIMTKLLLERNDNKVIILYPMSFNSAYRKEQRYLFSKIFNSIIEKKEICIGNTYRYRELLHPKFVVQESLNATEHKIIGSGRLIFINDFIRDLYKIFNMKYEDYVQENLNNKDDRGIFYTDNKKCLCSYEELLRDTVIDVVRILGQRGEYDRIPSGLL